MLREKDRLVWPGWLSGHTILFAPGKEAETMGKWRGSHVAVLFTLLGGLLAAVAAEAQDELFVTNFNNNSVTVYSRTASGDTAPLRTLSGAATGLSQPAGVALDLTNNELVVANDNINLVTVYTRTATGNTAPLRTLTGAATGLTGLFGVAVTAGASTPIPTLSEWAQIGLALILTAVAVWHLRRRRPLRTA